MLLESQIIFSTDSDNQINELNEQINELNCKLIN